jgi:putative transposase
VIEVEKANYDVAWMCRLLHVPRSSFYAWRNRAETADQARRRQLSVEVARVFTAGRGASGCRRVAAQLNREGHDCSVGLVADLMHELGLAAVQPRAYKRTTARGEDPVDSPNLIGRNFTTDCTPGQRLVGDITYLRTGEGWLYLATVLDLATRMVIGWQMAPHMRTTLIIDALEMARDSGHVQPGAIFHSDRGAQYTSTEFHQRIAGSWTRDIRQGRGPLDYLYRAVDQHGQVIDVLLSTRRDAAAARRFFAGARRFGPSPVEVTTDRAPVYPRIIEDLQPAARHITHQYANNRVEVDHGWLKSQAAAHARTQTTGVSTHDRCRACVRAKPTPRSLRPHRRRANP